MKSITAAFSTVLLSVVLCRAASSVIAATSLPDFGLQPPRVITNPGSEYARKERGSQGVAGIERSPKGRLWATWYTAKGTRGVENPNSYVTLATSADDGRTWQEPKMIIQARRFVHTYDPCLWLDPTGRLWFFWAQSAGMQDGRMGVWTIVTSEPEAENPRWSEPRRLANGIMLNKPTVLKNGDWLLPIGMWRDNTGLPNISWKDEELAPYTQAMLSHDLGDERGSNVYRSRDQGRTFERIGQVRIYPTRSDEHMIIERRDGSLWMLVRTTWGIGQSTSTDGGMTWTPGTKYMEAKNVAGRRFFIRRLQSGALLMVRNNGPTPARTHLTAFVSDDDGVSWKGGLLLDEGESSYPDGTQAADGRLYVIYDHQRYTLNKEGKKGIGGVFMSVFREDDVRAGRAQSDAARLNVVISRLQ